MIIINVYVHWCRQMRSIFHQQLINIFFMYAIFEGYCKDLSFCVGSLPGSLKWSSCVVCLV